MTLARATGSGVAERDASHRVPHRGRTRVGSVPWVPRVIDAAGERDAVRVHERGKEKLEAGLVAVVPDPLDARAHIVRRTPEGDRPYHVEVNPSSAPDVPGLRTLARDPAAFIVWSYPGVRATADRATAPSANEPVGSPSRRKSAVRRRCRSSSGSETQ